jgi:hypothetical protein
MEDILSKIKTGHIVRFHRKTIKKCFWENVLLLVGSEIILNETYNTNDGDTIKDVNIVLSDTEAVEYYNKNEKYCIEIYKL